LGLVIAASAGTTARFSHLRNRRGIVRIQENTISRRPRFRSLDLWSKLGIESRRELGYDTKFRATGLQEMLGGDFRSANTFMVKFALRIADGG
jgi:hypothetical protein